MLRFLFIILVVFFVPSSVFAVGELEWMPAQYNCTTTGADYTGAYENVIYDAENHMIVNANYISNRDPWVSKTNCSYEVYAQKENLTTGLCYWYKTAQTQVLGSVQGSSFAPPPSTVPFECAPPCEDEKAAFEASCPSGLVDYSGWSDETCSGAVCRNACESPGEYTAVQCSEAYPGSTYNNEDCSCVSPDCGSARASLEASCGSLGIENWSNATCSGDCDIPSCEDKLASCQSSCGSAGIDSFQCDQNGDSVVDSCVCKVPDEFPPLAHLEPVPDPGGTPAAGIQPSSDGGVDPITLDPVESPVARPNPSSDPPIDEIASWVKPVKENLDDLKNQIGGLAKDTRAGVQNDQVAIGKLDTIAKNTASIANNQGVDSGKLSAIASNTGLTVEGLNRVVDAIGNIDNSGPSNAVVKGTASLPAVNTYDSTVEGLEADTFFSAVSDFITSGLPLVGFIQGTSLSVSGADPSLNAVIWGKTVEFRIDQYESILNKMGLVLVFCTSVAGFMIIIGRW